MGIPEVIDGTSGIPKDGWGNEPPLESRTRNLGRFAELGPPDIVYIRKRFTPVVGGTKTFGYYHFVRGVSVDSAASVAAYLVDLVTNGLDAQTWVSSGSYEIAGATFRAYNACSKVDVVVDLKLPGGVSAHGVGLEGKDIELTESIWYETAVCSALRHAGACGESPLYPCLRVMRPDIDTFEKTLCTSAMECVPSWAGVGRADRGERPATPGTSKIAYAINDYFMAFCRYDKSVEFFSSDAVSTACPEMLVHVATSYRLQEDYIKASDCIDEALRRNPNSAMAWMSRSRVAKAEGNLGDALEAASKACECESAGIGEFINLAEICTMMYKYQDAFIALNSANIPQLDLDYYLRDLVPNRGNKTAPASGHAKGSDAVNVLAHRAKKERNAFNSKCDEALNELPGKVMTPAEHDCYEILVKILIDVGWDKLLKYRGTAFVMETDINENDKESEIKASGASSESASNKENDVAGKAGKPKENGVPSANGDTNTREYNGNGESVSKIDTGNVDDEEVPGLTVESPIPDGLMDVPITPSENTLKKETHVSRGAGKVVCKPWLDYLVTVMYEDLRALAVWNAEERSFPAPSTNGPSSSKSSTPVIVNNDDDNPPRRTADEVASTSKRPPPDWLRRGELALRLQKVEDAKTAFWTCIRLSEKAKTPALCAHLNLMDLAASEGDAATTLLCADTVWSFVEGACDKKNSESNKTVIGAPRPVQRAIFNVVSRLGLKKVREALAKANVDRNRMRAVLLDAVSWKVHGYDR